MLTGWAYITSAFAFHTHMHTHDVFLSISSCEKLTRLLLTCFRFVWKTYGLLLTFLWFVLSFWAAAGVKVKCSCAGDSGSVELSSGTLSSCRCTFCGLAWSPAPGLPPWWARSTIDCGCQLNNIQRLQKHKNGYMEWYGIEIKSLRHFEDNDVNNFHYTTSFPEGELWAFHINYSHTDICKGT